MINRIATTLVTVAILLAGYQVSQAYLKAMQDSIDMIPVPCQEDEHSSPTNITGGY